LGTAITHSISWGKGEKGRKKKEEERRSVVSQRLPYHRSFYTPEEKRRKEKQRRGRYDYEGDLARLGDRSPIPLSSFPPGKREKKWFDEAAPLNITLPKKKKKKERAI